MPYHPLYRRPSRTLVRLVCLGALAMTPPAGAVAQESRANAIAEQQAAKASKLLPPEPSKAERIFLKVKENFLEDPSGFYPYFESVYGGGSFTLGAGYRAFTGDNTFVDVRGLYSILGYKLVEGVVTSPALAGGQLAVEGRVGWRDATQVGYFGLGTSSSKEDRANYRFKEGYVGAGARLRPVPWAVLGARLSYDDYTLEEGRGSFPSIEEVYTPETAPGLGDSPGFIHTTASGAIDWRPSAGYARRGGLYEVRYENYADRDDTNSFDRIDVELVQHLPILRETWVLSFRGLMQTTLDDNDQVPYFLLPALGSGSTLRGYTSWRFRDRHSLLLQGEWRWTPNRLGLDMAIFYDAGKVTSRRSDLNLERLKSDVGIGIRFHGPAATPLRIELARGNEGINLVFSGSASF